MISSICAGIWAYDQSVADGLSGWKRTHFPSAAAWTHALGELGYRQVSDPGAMAKALRRLPSQLDSDGATWASADTRWVAVFGNAERGIPISAYCLGCESQPSAWEPRGSGWDGFDSVLERAQQAARHFQPITRQKQEEPRDLREIRY